MRRSYANRRDANEGDIVSALRAIGCTVKRFNDVDLLVGYRNLTMILECKDGAKSPSRRKLTPDQVIFQAEWRGHYAVVKSVGEAIAEVQRHTLRINR